MTRLALFVLIVVNIWASVVFRQQPQSEELDAAVSPTVSAEGNDYATDVLGNAWDMNEYKDISKYLNTSGVVINLANIQVQNGIFSARSNTSDAYFFPLFPGYGQDAINPGGYGVNYPIQSSKYHCLSMRMKVDTETNDEIRVFWFADHRLTDGPFGVTRIIPVSANTWKIYEVDLNLDFDNANSNTAWSGRSHWQGIRIDPTRFNNKSIQVDWVRLTDCAAKNVTVTWPSVGSNVEIWMSRNSGVLETRLAGPISGSPGNAVINVSGWEAGNYHLAVRNISSGTVQWTNFRIEPKTGINISRPSFTSGEGIIWPMNSTSELVYGIDRTRCVIHTFNNGVLEMETRPAATIGGGCTASGFSDPQLYFNLPFQIDPTQYRYLTYRLQTVGSWQDINRGWVGRWIWYYNRPSGQLCIAVSHDISIDVDWERYALDMHQPATGTPEYVEYCGTTLPWSAYPIHTLRFDPNENATQYSIFQNLDWVSLNKMDQISAGASFPIMVNFSKAASQLTLHFFYTTDRNQPKQHPVQLVPPPPPPNQSGSEVVFLPLIQNRSTTGVVDGISYLWNTQGVALGVYFICVEAIDSVGNQSIRCSEAPLRVN